MKEKKEGSSGLHSFLHGFWHL